MKLENARTMPKEKWDKIREESIKKGRFRMYYARRIKPKLSTTKMKEYADAHNLHYCKEHWNIYHAIQELIYQKRFKNTIDSIKNALWHIEIEHRKQFKRLFWEEYLFEYDSFFNFDTKYSDMTKQVKYLNSIKKILDDNPEYQGITGFQLQEVYGNRLSGRDMPFTWRAWGKLMSAYMNSKAKRRKFDYMSFYM